MTQPRQRLGLNIDHVATIRNARGGVHPDPARAAAMAHAAGADGLTIHLREDRRHIQDADLQKVREASDLPINLEMAATEEMTEIAVAFKPHAACIVPEKREERTTEGGLDVAGLHNQIAPMVRRLADAGCRVSLFIEPDPVQIAVAEVLGAPVIELHTGRYAELWLEGGADAASSELERIRLAAVEARKRGLEPHAGHGLTFYNVKPIAAISEIAELNIGHFLIGEAIFTGLDTAVKHMRALMDEAQAERAR
ncbi:pyridoxine 5'-phosphate synthase [Oceanicaulis alexandrii]|uniref:pyridoxine 5'-phosphate synthase n=1 Tax=Oceanicaulis alexandrii TaxID=153233 RepID=UPI0003B6C4F3|nr:pyridoxine 5'-phosphate synthase [Oceanicaulis alexandrii]